MYRLRQGMILLHARLRRGRWYRTEGGKLYSVPEAAKFLGGISKWTVHAWLSQGKLRRTKIGARTMIRESELQRFIEDGEQSSRVANASPVLEAR